jgi:hypothetical protein
MKLVQGEIGILDAESMDHFADIFMAYQKRSKHDHGSPGMRVNGVFLFYDSRGMLGL